MPNINRVMKISFPLQSDNNILRIVATHIVYKNDSPIIFIKLSLFFKKSPPCLELLI